ncbi:MAG: sugar ABC transporter ATP-binding protein, partial [Acidobacteria bacterium]|nr:sugar ABC transporter ATP-binding protein [Acidobacteriota bacterium]
MALGGVSLDLCAGEVHALVGENGAGKSTLIKIICGALAPDSGKLFFRGRQVRWPTPVAARAQGMVTVHQEPELFPTLSVAENMALAGGLPLRGTGLVDWNRVHRQARETVRQIGERIDVRQPASRLSVAHRQMIQVAAAILQNAKVVVLDEPTSALSGEEARWLFQQIERLKAGGAGILYISHRQEEIFRLADRITVLRDGLKVWTRARQSVGPEETIEAMVGRPASTLAASPSGRASSRATREGPVRFQVSGFTDRGGRFRHLDLKARSGEIVGIYGLVGAGRSEFARGVFGLRPAEGLVRIDGSRCEIGRPREALNAGIAYVPEDRLSQGLCLGLPVRSNAVLSTLRRWTRGLLASRTREQQATRQVSDRLEVRYRSTEQPIQQLSGGNQQKVVLGRWLLAQPKVLILDEPTRGVDVGAKAEIHRHLRHLAREGCAILLISSELPEIMEHSDRVVVFREGETAGEFDPRQTSPARVAALALPRQSTEGAAAETRSGESRFRGRSFNELALLMCVAGLGLWLTVSTEGFSLLNLLTHASLWAVLGLAAGSVIVGRGIDISIGS